MSSAYKTSVAIKFETRLKDDDKSLRLDFGTEGEVEVGGWGLGREGEEDMG
jgi:hypothetical protein